MRNSPQRLREIIVALFPDCRHARFTLHDAGWDSIAVEVDNRLIFKFPRHAEAEGRLTAEATLLAAIRPHVTMKLPALEIFPTPRLFSRHAKLPGAHLLASHYAMLPELARDRLAEDVALFFSELHSLGHDMMRSAGAGPVGAWLPPDELLREAWPRLPHHLRGYAARTVKAWGDLPPDPYGIVYSHFDTHGWNMAFDHETRRLNGIYDFGDSGFGDLHRDFVQPSWIGPDFVARLAIAYAGLTRRPLDPQRIRLLSGVLRLSELGGAEPAKVDEMVASVADWAALPPA